MARVHAYADDALGDHDAVGLAEAIPARRVSIPEVVEAAIARTQQVAPEPERRRRRVLRPRPGRGAPTRAAGSSPASRRTSRTTPTSPACPRCRAPTPSRRRPPRATATSPGCSWRPVSSRSARPSSPSTASAPRPSTRASDRSARPGRPSTPRAPRRPAPPRSSPPVPSHWRTPTTAAARSASRPRSTGSSGSSPPGVAWPRTGCCAQMPVRIVADGVVTRSVRDTAAFLREAETRLSRPPRWLPSATSPAPPEPAARSRWSPTASARPRHRRS